MVLFFTFIEDLLCISKAFRYKKKINDIAPRNLEYNLERKDLHIQKTCIQEQGKRTTDFSQSGGAVCSLRNGEVIGPRFINRLHTGSTNRASRKVEGSPDSSNS